MDGSQSRVLRFGRFSLDIGRGILSREGQSLSLRRQSFDVLRFLAERPSQVISKEQLATAVWEVQPSDPDASIVQCIKDIRAVMGEDARWMIRTVPSTGYEFKAEVHHELGGTAAISDPKPETERPSANFQPEPAPTNASRPAAIDPFDLLKSRTVALGVAALLVIAAALVLPAMRGNPAPAVQVMLMMATPSVAVLPFQTPTRSAGSDDGGAVLAEEIATELVRVPRGFNIAIKSASSHKSQVADPKSLGRELDVRYLLLGTVRPEGGTVHVNVRIILAESGRQIWAEPFQYVPGDEGAQQRTTSRIARLATEEVLIAESKLPLPTEPRADHYAILGRAAVSGKSSAKANAEAMHLFKKGLDLDRNSVSALQGFARTKITAVQSGWVARDQRAQWLDEAEISIARILELRARSYGAYRLRGSLLRARREPDQALKAFERALELNSGYGSALAELGRTKIDVGRLDEGFEDIKRAIMRNPTDPALHAWCLWAGQAAIHLGNFTEALDWLRKAQEIDPANEQPVLWIAVAQGELGSLAKARSLMAEFLAKNREFHITDWNDENPRANPLVAARRARIAHVLCLLGAPGCSSATAPAQ